MRLSNVMYTEYIVGTHFPASQEHKSSKTAYCLLVFPTISKRKELIEKEGHEQTIKKLILYMEIDG